MPKDQPRKERVQTGRYVQTTDPETIAIAHCVNAIETECTTPEQRRRVIEYLETRFGLVEVPE